MVRHPRRHLPHAVAAGPGIRTADGTFRIQEKSGWWDLSGVMSRTWDWLTLSMTTANLMTNLGGAKAEDILKDPGKRFYKNAPLKPEAVAETYGPYIKDASTYLGIHMVDKDGNKTYEANTDSPTWGYFFDGIPSKIDPRAFAYYVLPSDYDNRIETGYATFPSSKAPLLSPIDEANFANAPQFDVSFSWNGLPCGYGYDDLFTSKNALYNSSNGSKLNYGKTYPQLQERYRNNNEYRVFFGPWETYFLLAEAAVRGWNAGMGAQAAYEAGIKASFEYLNVDANYEAYINSEDYNRVGTSVKFTHTAEPQDYTIEYLDPVSNTMKTMTYKYPVASKTLYGKALNDQLTKIITQKFIANTPWLPLENWSDHRRTGLRFLGDALRIHRVPVPERLDQDVLPDGPEGGFLCPAHELPEFLQERQPDRVQARPRTDGHDGREHRDPAVVGEEVTVSTDHEFGRPFGAARFFLCVAGTNRLSPRAAAAAP